MLKGGQAGFTWSATSLPRASTSTRRAVRSPGTPDGPGDFKIKIGVKDRVGATKDKEFDLHVKA